MQTILKEYLNIDSLLISFYTCSVLLFSYTEGMTFITKLSAIAIFFRYVYLSLNGERIIVTREFGIAALWCVWALIGILFAISPEKAADKAFTVFQVIAASFIFSRLVIRVNAFDVVWFSYLMATIYISLITYLDPAKYTVMERLVGTLGNANLYGLVVFVAITAGLYFISKAKSITVKLLFFAPVPFLYTMMLGTGSRKAMIVVTVILALFAYVEIRNRIRKSVLQGAITIALAVTGIGLGLQALVESDHYSRLGDLFTAAETGNMRETDGSFQHRIELYQGALRTALSNPIIGIGLDNFSVVNIEGSVGGYVGTYSHSNIAEILVSTGLIGFLIYFSMYLSIAVRLLRSYAHPLRKEDSHLFMLISMLFLSYVMYDFAMVSYYEKVSWLTLATLIAGSAVTETQGKLLSLERRKRQTVSANTSSKQHG